MPKRTTLDAILAEHRGVLLDAYGVLLAQDGPLPGAAALTARLEEEKRPWFLVTNDASRHPSNIAAHHRGLGIAMPDERVLSSGALLRDWYREESLEGAASLVLGPDDALRMVVEAGGDARRWNECDVPDVVVVADEAGYPFLEAVDRVLSLILARTPRLVLPNPDRVFPKSSASFGIAAGSIALILENALHRRSPDAPGFVPLGKPERRLFDKARALADTDDLVMFGDQLETDIAGARAAGLFSALVETGVGRWRDDVRQELTPDYLLERL